MKNLFLIVSLLILSSCAPTFGTKFTTPGFGVISQPISKAQDAALRANQNAKTVYTDGALPKSEIVKLIYDDTSAVIKSLKDAQLAVNDKEVEIEKLTRASNDLIAKNNKLVMEGQKANKAIWVRNFIILGLGIWALKTPLLFVLRWLLKLVGLASLGI